jgi:serine phosphatase RsbU (regulator of sigma subunit)
LKAIRQKKEGAAIVALGFLIYFFFNIFDAMMDSGISTIFQDMENPYAFGTIGFLVTMSLVLSKQYARTHQQLLAKERHSRELEEARQLQLSMLPPCPGQPAGQDICFYMRTATEVGGDYYDFIVENNNTLVLTVGDATGHGLKAGIMVTAIKSLFLTMGTDRDIPAFFNRCTETVKQMKMGNLYMALAVMRLHRNTLTVSSAGMPPLLIYRQSSHQVEEIMLKGPPLGGFTGFSYATAETMVAPGDILLLMSDGFPELFNEKGEMLGYDRAKEIFLQGAHDTATDVVHYLRAEAEKWRNNREQDDDITFAVIKIQENT